LTLAPPRNERGAHKNAKACGGALCVRIIIPLSTRISPKRSDESKLYSNDREMVL